MSGPTRPGRIVTFYSYKGGTGRSMALANVAWILASGSKRVLVLDWDLEAPGLQRYFRPFLLDKDLTSSEGVVDFITDFMLEAITPVAEGETVPADWYAERADLSQYAVSLNWKFPRGGQIDFVPAGRQGPDYATRFAAINWQNFYDRLGGGALLEEAKRQASAQYDYVLIDSRTGVSDTSGICTVQMPDTLVVCFTFNNQSIEGAAAITQFVYEQRGRHSYAAAQAGAAAPAQSAQSAQPAQPAQTRSGDGAGPASAVGSVYESPHDFRILPVPTRVELAEKEKLDRRKEFARWRFDPFIGRIPAAQRRAFWAAVEVPYVPYFAYEEILAPFNEDPRDPKSCLAAFVRITEQITEGEVSAFVPLIDPKKREEVLVEFAATSEPDERAPAPAAGTVPAESQTERQLRLAESSFLALTEEERETAARLWKRLVRVPRPGEGVENSKVRVRVDELGPDAAALANKLSASEVLTFGKDADGKATVEATSEELLRTWPRLLKWIEDDRPFLLWRQQLQTRLAEWGHSGSVTDGILHGAELSEAESYLRDRRPDLAQQEIFYVGTSAATRRQRRRRQATIALAAAVGGVVILLTYYVATTMAASRARRETAQALAAAARARFGEASKVTTSKEADEVQLGLLTAVVAHRTDPTAESGAALREGIALLPRRLPPVNLGGPAGSIAFSPDGSRLTAVTADNTRGNNIPRTDGTAAKETWTVTVVDVEKGSVVGNPVPIGSRAGYELSPDGRYIALLNNATPRDIRQAAPKFTVDVWEIASNRIIGSFDYAGPLEYELESPSMVFSDNGNYFAFGYGDAARLIDLNSGQQITHKPKLGATGYIRGFSRDGRFVILHGSGGLSLSVCDIRPAVALEQTQPERAPRELVALSTVQLDKTPNSTDISADGKRLALGSIDGYYEIRDVEGGMLLSRFGEAKAFSRIKFGPLDGQAVTASLSDRLIRLWDISGAEGRELKRLQVETGRRGIGFSFSADAKYSAWNSDDLAKVWDTSKAFEQPMLLLLGGTINSLVFSADNSRVATAGVDGFVRVWDLKAGAGGDLVADACARVSRWMTDAEWAQLNLRGVANQNYCEAAGATPAAAAGVFRKGW